MGYAEATAYLDALGVDAMKKLAPSTHRIEALCDLLDNPERAIPAIHITGTNGKSSTARIATGILAAAGLSVATYTSPHLSSVRERLARDGTPIDEEGFAELFDHVKPYVDAVEARLGESISYFELLTAMFYLWAAEAPVDAVVVEVGLGGRWDATNVLTSSIPVITNIGLDHTAQLGPDRVSIAKEKVGIVKQGSTLVTAERDPKILEVFASEGAASVAALGRDFEVLEDRIAIGGRYLSLISSGGTYEGLFLPLHGAHQAVNAATALEAVTRFIPARKLSHDVVLEGLARTTASGRMETIVTDRTPAPVVLDVAHNPDGMSMMVTALIEAFAFERVIYVFGALQDKDHRGMLAEIARTDATIVATEARSARSVPPDDIAKVSVDLGLGAEIAGDVDDALDVAMDLVGENDLICVTGSHYVVGEARDLLLASP
ncbi:MAG TPA: folylpolyglutamate synthase/dihydrofolate synthase family protein [Actinomycetota bacterium]|nr:folylpolyglutamate synthase/dihydrofolate synthase family protein [Actinomycetota bacterium]